MSTVLILANGGPPSHAALQAFLPDVGTIICADGGARHALKLGLRPDLVIGDFDSLSEAELNHLMAEGIPIERFSANKDQTDLELALQAAMRHQPTRILLAAALGGRLDQQLANILLLTQSAWQGVRLGLVDEGQVAWLMRGPDQLQLSGQEGDTLSLVPLSAEVSGLSIEGVAWPLKQAQTTLGSTLTISNRFAATNVQINLDNGMALALQLASDSNPADH